MVSYSGRVIEFLSSGAIKLGHVTREGESRLRVIDQHGRHHSVSLNNVAVIHQETNHAVPFAELANQLELDIQRLLREIDTELLWDSVASEQRIFSLEELSKLYFGATSSLQMSAIYRGVQRDQLRFKVRGLIIQPRSPEQVEQQLRSIQRRTERETLRQQSLAWMRQVFQQEETISVPDEMEDLIRKIEDFLKRREGTQVQGWLSEVSCEHTPVEVAIEILALTGRLKEDAHHLLILAGIEEQFPHEVSKSCSRLIPYRSSPARLDCSGQLTFTIDDEDTQELDDALSFESHDGYSRVGIHIADVSYFVEKGDLLDSEALRRSTSVYLPDRTVNMFPPRLSSDLASLNANVFRPVMSFLVEFSDEGNIIDWRLERSQISVDHRLSYEMADELISGNAATVLAEALRRLASLSRHIAEQRHSSGALTINRPELKIRVDDGKIDVKVLDVVSVSRRLVSEMMILANSLAAEFASVNRVPIIFRAQNAPAKHITAPEKYDPVALDSLFQVLEPSRLSVYPQPHASLGLTSYTQLTSPIRRFTDLVIQRQLSAHLAGDSLPYELQELMEILATVQAADSNVRALERKARRLFLLKYLAQRSETGFDVIVIKKLSSGHLVETLDLFVRGHLVGQTDYEPGQLVNAAVDSIEPDKGIFRLRPI